MWHVESCLALLALGERLQKIFVKAAPMGMSLKMKKNGQQSVSIHLISSQKNGVNYLFIKHDHATLLEEPYFRRCK